MVTLYMKKAKIFLLITCILSGCSMAIYMREFPSHKPKQGWLFPIYPATTMSIALVVSGGGILQFGDCNNAPLISRILGWCVVTPLSLTAIPMSAATDTVLLPFDLCRSPASKSQSGVLSASDSRAICISHLLDISLAKYKWADEHHATNGASVNASEVLSRCPNPASVTNCPSGGTIYFDVIGRSPRCSVPGHEIPE